VLARNWVMIPHVTHNDEADITDLEACASSSTRSTPVTASKADDGLVPDRRRGRDAEGDLHADFQLLLDAVVYYKHRLDRRHPGGLVVPVYQGADGKGLLEIARELPSCRQGSRGKLLPAT